MAKYAVPFYDDPPTRRRQPIGPLLGWAASGIVCIPLAFDGARLIIARWRAMYGVIDRVDTPAIDLMSRAVAALLDACHVLSTRPFRDLPWQGESVLAIAVGWAVIGGLMLRSRWR